MIVTKRCKRTLHLKLDVNVRVHLVRTMVARMSNRFENGCAYNYNASVHDGERSRIERVFRNRTYNLDTSSELQLISTEDYY